MSKQPIRDWFRTIEFFERPKGWYFLSPDGLAVGPYDSEGDAVRHASRLATLLKAVDADEVKATVLEFAIQGQRSKA